MERSGTLGADMNRRPALKEQQMLAVFFARALGWESDRLDTRSPVYKRLPLFQLSERTALVFSTQGSASLHPGLRSLTPSAYLRKISWYYVVEVRSTTLNTYKRFVRLSGF